MNAALVLAYALIFLLGPAFALVLLSRAPGGREVRLLGGGIGLLIVGAFGWSLMATGGAFVTPLLLWVAWVISMALVGQVLRLMLEDPPKARRWTAAVAAIGATIPWFGIVIAQTMAG
ncbi:hypothetical protein [Thalassococcus sp. S3]|uniref:hypothetical protein n=1 Tax=Thalassococcus sp. S3 TaxID=2017482 RepID=UPI001024533C|nr:hypothetical protein [Thalassococcus sp. S3]QBF33177.1 hypothetical protein CFI11_18380 [Thalassococcus sp. S3]